LVIGWLILPYESGGQAGCCSKEFEILMNSEINEHIKKNSITLVFYKKEAVKVPFWGNQWVAYDNKETLEMKFEHA
jgi:chitinase